MCCVCFNEGNAHMRDGSSLGTEEACRCCSAVVDAVSVAEA